MRIFAILLVAAFVLSVTPVMVLADCPGHTSQAQVVKIQPAEKMSKEKSEKTSLLVAQEESKQKAPTEKK